MNDKIRQQIIQAFITDGRVTRPAGERDRYSATADLVDRVYQMGVKSGPTARKPVVNFFEQRTEIRNALMENIRPFIKKNLSNFAIQWIDYALDTAFGVGADSVVTTTESDSCGDDLGSTTLERVLEKSVEKNGGAHPLTLGHLLNIMRLARKISSREADSRESELDEILNDCMADKYRYGGD